MSRKRTIVFSEDLTMLSSDNNGSNSTQRSIPNEKGSDSSDIFLAIELSNSEKVADTQRFVSMWL